MLRLRIVLVAGDCVLVSTGAITTPTDKYIECHHNHFGSLLKRNHTDPTLGYVPYDSWSHSFSDS